MTADVAPRSTLLTLSSVVLALGWICAGLLTAVGLLLLAQPPVCASYDPDGRTAVKVGHIATAAAFVAVWVLSVVCLWRYGRGAGSRLLLALALPVAIVLTFITGTSATGAAIERVAPNSDHAMCW